ncbi:MAG: phosphate acyltransferase PlsX [Bacteroidetes bacterium HGW-Bacteroidetes-1]|jgi:glycerol-3-phosphate acyltransferase PlsX|nr:MAG: phosphate acyltransferase PlsX [Bacteroidetes bacterium HGW-Bacteroidetes-1]
MNLIQHIGKLRLGLDVTGGDFAPAVTLDGLVLLLPELKEGEIVVLFGDEEIIRSTVDSNLIETGRVEIVHSPEVIGMGEKPIKAFQGKKQSSIVKGFEFLHERKIDTFASAGNSGAMMVGAMNVVNTIPGIIRPSSVVMIPKLSGTSNIILDVGTNPDAKPDVLYQYGFLGSLYAKYVLGVEDPKVGLLSIGEEEKKGNLLVQSAYMLMKETQDFNFIGNVEGRDLFNDKTDVVVCDGFTGNIVIKQIQAMFRIMQKRGLVDDYFARFNYELHGGSPIIGINGNVVLGHGISSPLAIKNMMLLARNVAASQLNKKIKEALKGFVV